MCAGLAYRLAATWRGRGHGAGFAIGLAALRGFHVLSSAVGVDQPGGYPGGGGDDEKVAREVMLVNGRVRAARARTSYELELRLSHWS